MYIYIYMHMYVHKASFLMTQYNTYTVHPDTIGKDRTNGEWPAVFDTIERRIERPNTKSRRIPSGWYARRIKRGSRRRRAGINQHISRSRHT